jgi:hypothetical protein
MLEVAKHNDPVEIASTFTRVCKAWKKYPEELIVMLFHLDEDLRQTALEERERLISGFWMNQMLSEEMGPPVSMGSKAWPVLEKAPGKYVLEKEK